MAPSGLTSNENSNPRDRAVRFSDTPGRTESGRASLFNHALFPCIVPTTRWPAANPKFSGVREPNLRRASGGCACLYFHVLPDQFA